MATTGRAFIFFSIFFVADAMFKKAAKQLVSAQEESMSPRSFSREGGIGKAAGVPATPALLAAQPLKWMHTPKCGTSFVNALIHLPDVCPGADDSFQVDEEVLGDFFEFKFEAICPLVCDGRKFQCNTDGQGNPNMTHMGVGDQYELLKGHLVTMMRDPIQRISSAYSDAVFSHGKWGKEDIVTYAHSEAHAVTCQIMKDGIMDPPPVSCGDLNETDAEEALTRLREGFAFVGVVEEWDLSICLLHRMFGGDCLASDFMDDRPTFPGEKDHEYNTSALEGYDDPVDRLLYNGARELFAERLLEYNVSQESCQPCFAQAKLKSA